MSLRDDATPVLDHGYVRLVESMGSDLSIVRAARNSYNAEPRRDGSDTKLIHRLIRDVHTSPFEAVVFTFDVKAPIFVFRQWHRHRTWSYSEVSGRYSVLPEEFYVPQSQHIGIQSRVDKQSREMAGALTEAELKAAELMATTIELQCRKAFETYQSLIANGVPRELARGILPLNTYSRMFATVDLHNLFHFLRLRLDFHAQWEIQEYARVLLELIKPIVPDSAQYFEEHL